MVKLDKMNELLVLAMENLLNNNDPKASKNETISVDDALAVAKLGKVSVDSYKVKLQAIKLINKTDKPEETERMLLDAGLLEGENETLKSLKK